MDDGARFESVGLALTLSDASTFRNVSCSYPNLGRFVKRTAVALEERTTERIDTPVRRRLRRAQLGGLRRRHRDRPHRQLVADTLATGAPLYFREAREGAVFVQFNFKESLFPKVGFVPTFSSSSSPSSRQTMRKHDRPAGRWKASVQLAYSIAVLFATSTSPRNSLVSSPIWTIDRVTDGARSVVSRDTLHRHKASTPVSTTLKRQRIFYIAHLSTTDSRGENEMHTSIYCGFRS